MMWDLTGALWGRTWWRGACWPVRTSPSLHVLSQGNPARGADSPRVHARPVMTGFDYLPRKAPGRETKPNQQPGGRPHESKWRKPKVYHGSPARWHHRGEVPFRTTRHLPPHACRPVVGVRRVVTQPTTLVRRGRHR